MAVMKKNTSAGIDNTYSGDEETRKSTSAYYTPETVATLLASLAIDYRDMAKGHQASEPVTVGDIACGAGMLLVAAIRQVAKQKYRGQVKVVGCDIDLAALKKCVANCRATVKELGLDNVTLDIRLMPFGTWNSGKRHWSNGCRSDPPKQMGLDGTSKEVRVGGLELIRDGRVTGEAVSV